MLHKLDLFHILCFTLIHLAVFIGDCLLNVSKAKKNILTKATINDNIDDDSNERVQDSFNETDNDVSTQKYGSISDYRKTKKRKGNKKDDTSIIATEDDSTIESSSVSTNDDLFNYTSKPKKILLRNYI